MCIQTLYTPAMATKSPKGDRPNPRQHPKHRERGPAFVLKATWAGIARFLCMSIHTAKKYGTGKRRRFDPHSLESVADYREQRRGKPR